MTAALCELLGSLDRAGSDYGIRASIQTVGSDANWLDNVRVREWTRSQVLVPGKEYQLRYDFGNDTRDTVKGRWALEVHSVPIGGLLRTEPGLAVPLRIAPGQHAGGVLRFRAPPNVVEGSSLALNLALVDDTERVRASREWFLIADTAPPMASNYRVLVLGDRTVAIQVLLGDPISGVRPFGATATYSIDHGHTWSTRGMEPTVASSNRLMLFETRIGPFAPGARLWLRMAGTDVAGNRQGYLPRDAQAFLAPANAERLFLTDTDTGARGTEGSALFGWEGLVRSVENAGSTPCADDPCDTSTTPFLHGIERSRAADRRALLAILQGLQIDPSLTRRLGVQRSSWKMAGRGRLRFIELLVP